MTEKDIASISKVCSVLVTAMAGLQEEARPIYIIEDVEPIEEKLKVSIFSYFDN